MSIEIDLPEDDDPRYEGVMSFEVTIEATDPSPGWSGSAHSCPSDADWYGEAATFESWTSVSVFDLTLGEGGEERDANPHERALLDKWVGKGGEGQEWFDAKIAELGTIAAERNAERDFR